MDGIIKSLSDMVTNSISVIIIVFQLFVVIMAITLPLALMNRFAKKNDTPQEEKEIEPTPPPEGKESAPVTEDEFPYVKPYLLTKNEWKFYKDLHPICNKYKLHILSKVRMADIVSVKSGIHGKKFTDAFNKIKSKHVDFVIANPSNLAVLCVIELDDSSHDKIESQQSDFFKDETFVKIGLPYIRVTSSAGIEEKLCSTLNIKQKLQTYYQQPTEL